MKFLDDERFFFLVKKKEMLRYLTFYGTIRSKSEVFMIGILGGADKKCLGSL